MQELDIQAIVQIERMSFSTPWSETSFFNEIYKNKALAKVAVSDGVIAGYVCAEHILDEGHILDLAVRPDYRGMGIASLLVRNTIKEMKARGCRVLYLEARASNSAAKRLYQGLGFKVVSTRKGYYTAPVEDAVLMERDLAADGF